MPMGLPTVVPNQLIESAHINNIADRVVGRFGTAGELNAAVPSPTSGMVATVAGVLYTYKNSAWRAHVSPVSVFAIGTGATSAGAFDIVGVTLPVLSAGRVHVTAYVRCDFAGGTNYEVKLRNGTTVDLATRVFAASDVASGQHHFLSFAASVEYTTANRQFNLRGDGSANMTTYSDTAANRIDVLYIPDPVPYP